MPMLLLTDEQLKKELSSVRVIDIKHGRGPTKEVPLELRKIIAEESINGAPAKTLANAFGVSESSISAYKNGATSTASYDNPNKELQEANKEVKDKISDAARSKLLSALDNLTSDKIESAKARDIAGIAKDMSVIVKNMEPTGPLVQNNAQVIVYRPRTRDEDEFDIIEVNE